jgi:hypothetical protein
MTQRRPATVTLRMSPALREALHAAADEAGCSLNAYALQVLASAAGDAARFRGARDEACEAPRDIDRDERGNPLDWKLRWAHVHARQEFARSTAEETDWATAGVLVRKYDQENPAFFVEWLAGVGRE